MDEIYNSLITEAFRPKREWVESCYKWLEQSRSSSGDALDARLHHKKVRQQLLHSDFYVSSVAVLPSYLHSKSEYNLQGRYCVQVNFVCYLNKSAYSQYVYFNGLCDTGNSDKFNLLGIGECEEDDEEVDATQAEKNPSSWGSHRSTRGFQITDGVSTYLCVELRPIPFLNRMMNAVGFKCQLKGPITVLNGQLFVDQHNINLMGGCVPCLNRNRFYKRLYGVMVGAESAPQCSEIIAPSGISSASLNVHQTNTTTLATKSDPKSPFQPEDIFFDESFMNQSLDLYFEEIDCLADASLSGAKVSTSLCAPVGVPDTILLESSSMSHSTESFAKTLPKSLNELDDSDLHIIDDSSLSVSGDNTNLNTISFMEGTLIYSSMAVQHAENDYRPYFDVVIKKDDGTEVRGILSQNALQRSPFNFSKLQVTNMASSSASPGVKLGLVRTYLSHVDSLKKSKCSFLLKVVSSVSGKTGETDLEVFSIKIYDCQTVEEIL